MAAIFPARPAARTWAAWSTCCVGSIECWVKLGFGNAGRSRPSVGAVVRGSLPSLPRQRPRLLPCVLCVRGNTARVRRGWASSSLASHIARIGSTLATHSVDPSVHIHLDHPDPFALPLHKAQASPQHRTPKFNQQQDHGERPQDPGARLLGRGHARARVRRQAVALLMCIVLGGRMWTSQGRDGRPLWCIVCGAAGPQPQEDGRPSVLWPARRPHHVVRSMIRPPRIIPAATTTTTIDATLTG